MLNAYYGLSNWSPQAQVDLLHALLYEERRFTCGSGAGGISRICSKTVLDNRGTL